ncbi:MAG: bifunctional oligoribonuclease and phosphatase NrnA [Frankiaceae bacterium]|nr:bifunctional oligoribonuclease and phosphatase NrnA [Frankiaceae bacterium]
MIDVATGVAGPNEAAWGRAVDLLCAAKTVVLACHIGPDGDALGSMLSLGLALERLGTDVVCSWGSETLVLPATYAGLLPGQHLLRPPAEVPQVPDCLVALDTASLDRLGLLAPLTGTAKETLVIDHHATNTHFGTFELVDPSSAATAVLVAELIQRLGVTLDAELAVGLYVGITTDTGSFRFSATTPDVHRLAAQLLATGIRHDEIARAIYDTHDFGYVKLLGEALSRASLERDAVGGRGLVWTYTTADEMTGHGLRMDQIEGIIDGVRVTAQAEVAVLLKGDLDGTYKVSTRSKGAIDMSLICGQFHGGGHRFAAGFTAHGSVDETMAQLRAALSAAVPLSG